MRPVNRKDTSLTCNVSFMQRTWAILDAKGAGSVSVTCTVEISRTAEEISSCLGREWETRTQQQLVLVSLAVQRGSTSCRTVTLHNVATGSRCTDQRVVYLQKITGQFFKGKLFICVWVDLNTLKKPFFWEENGRQTLTYNRLQV